MKKHIEICNMPINLREEESNSSNITHDFLHEFTRKKKSSSGECLDVCKVWGVVIHRGGVKYNSCFSGTAS